MTTSSEPTTHPPDVTLLHEKSDPKKVDQGGDLISFAGVVAFAVLAGMCSGLPIWALTIAFALLAIFLWSGNALSFYLAVIWLSSATLIPLLRNWGTLTQLTPTGIGLAVSITGLLACGLAYLERISPSYERWTRKPQKPVPQTMLEATQIDEEPELSRSLSGLWITIPIAALVATTLAIMIPFHSGLSAGRSPTDELLRLFRFVLIIAVPAWGISSLLGLIQWRKISPAQGYLFLLRTFYRYQGREQLAIEKRRSKRSRRTY